MGPSIDTLVFYGPARHMGGFRDSRVPLRKVHHTSLLDKVGFLLSLKDQSNEKL